MAGAAAVALRTGLSAGFAQMVEDHLTQIATLAEVVHWLVAQTMMACENEERVVEAMG